MSSSEGWRAPKCAADWDEWRRRQLAKAPTAADIAANPAKAERLARLLGLGPLAGGREMTERPVPTESRKKGAA